MGIGQDIVTGHLEQNGLLRIITDDDERRIRYPENSEFLMYQGALQHFVDCLITGREFETSGPETLKTMELVFGAYDSAENGRVYRVGADVGRLA